MKKSGHIKIKNGELRFVYYELPKPTHKLLSDFFGRIGFDVKEYKASKREVKIENINWSIGHQLPKRLSDQSFRIYMINQKTPECKYFDAIVKNDDPCEADVVNGKATITKIA